MTYFNPPWESNVATNVGKTFLQLIDNCFPIGHKLRQVMNRNTIKISYSTMPNVGQIINSYNKRKLRGCSNGLHNLTCSCRNIVCPLQGKCNTKDIVYLARVVENSKEEAAYIGMTSEEFRKRYSKHIQSFKNSKYKNETTLSRKIWNMKEDGLDPTVNFEILKQSKSYQAGDRSCLLCTDEKIEIIFNTNKLQLLNNRKEIFSKCRHRARMKIDKI